MSWYIIYIRCENISSSGSVVSFSVRVTKCYRLAISDDMSQIRHSHLWYIVHNLICIRIFSIWVLIFKILLFWQGYTCTTDRRWQANLCTSEQATGEPRPARECLQWMFTVSITPPCLCWAPFWPGLSWPGASTAATASNVWPLLVRQRWCQSIFHHCSIL